MSSCRYFSHSSIISLGGESSRTVILEEKNRTQTNSCASCFVIRLWVPFKLLILQRSRIILCKERKKERRKKILCIPGGLTIVKYSKGLIQGVTLVVSHHSYLSRRSSQVFYYFLNYVYLDTEVIKIRSPIASTHENKGQTVKNK